MAFIHVSCHLTTLTRISVPFLHASCLDPVFPREFGIFYASYVTNPHFNKDFVSF